MCVEIRFAVLLTSGSSSAKLFVVILSQPLKVWFLCKSGWLAICTEERNSEEKDGFRRTWLWPEHLVWMDYLNRTSINRLCVLDLSCIVTWIAWSWIPNDEVPNTKRARRDISKSLSYHRLPWRRAQTIRPLSSAQGAASSPQTMVWGICRSFSSRTFDCNGQGGFEGTWFSQAALFHVQIWKPSGAQHEPCGGHPLARVACDAARGPKQWRWHLREVPLCRDIFTVRWRAGLRSLGVWDRALRWRCRLLFFCTFCNFCLLEIGWENTEQSRSDLFNFFLLGLRGVKHVEPALLAGVEHFVGGGD